MFTLFFYTLPVYCMVIGGAVDYTQGKYKCEHRSCFILIAPLSPPAAASGDEGKGSFNMYSHAVTPFVTMGSHRHQHRTIPEPSQ